MKIPISWLKDYVSIDENPKALADALTNSGSKVEKIEHLGQEISGVVVGRIAKILPHPNADKLVITHVDVGGAGQVQIVTGATNLTEGDFIPVALHGATLAGGLQIKKGKIRGEVSDGMLCSIEELGYTRTDYPEAPEDGIYIFETSQPLGADARPILGLLDDVIEFELTSNRPDCYSVIGMAREAAATMNQKLEIKNEKYNLMEKGAGNVTDLVDVEIRNEELCPRYVARVVENVRIGPSPQWMRRRLTGAGLRPVNNIVDITNYVMLEYGQPMHAFDIRAIQGRIVVRNAEQDEKITTLDGVERILDSQIMVIADEAKVIGIAGVMGGELSKINDDTTTILFESANFSGPNIRRTSKKLALRTDSSSKYEKGLDPNLAQKCADRACQLVEELNCGEVVPGFVDKYPTPRLPHKVPFTTEKINALLGISLSCQEMDDIFARLGIYVSNDMAEIPTHRADIQIWEDLAEEAARLYGYNNIPAAIASSSNVGKKSHWQIMEEQAMEIAVALGFSQALTFAFESPKVFDKLFISAESPIRNTVRITNPLGEDTSIMRTTMLNPMLTSLSTNYAKRNEEAALFEIAKVYRPTSPGQLPFEGRHLAMGYYGDKDFFHMKGVLETFAEFFGVDAEDFCADSTLPFFHPGQCGRLYIDDKPAATCGRIHPAVAENYNIDKPVYILVIYLDVFFAASDTGKTYTPLPRFPEVYRDIAITVDKTIKHSDLAATIRENGGKYLKNLRLFDVYEGKNLPEGTKSMAYSLAFRADDRTLTDEEVTKAINKILIAIEAAYDAKLRT